MASPWVCVGRWEEGCEMWDYRGECVRVEAAEVVHTAVCVRVVVSVSTGVQGA